MSENKDGFKKLISLIYQWRKFIVINIVVAAISAVTIALILPKTFSSRSTILPPSTSPISNILPTQMTGGLGGAISSITGGSGSDTYRIVAILKSRTLAENAIQEFNLIEFFDAATIEDAIESYREMSTVTIDEEAMINITTYAKTKFFHLEDDESEMRDLALNLNEFLVTELENKFTTLQVEKARYDRITVEKRLEENIEELNQAENELKSFSEKYGVIALPEQLEALVISAADLESQIIINEVELSLLESTFRQEDEKVRQKSLVIKQLNEKLNSLIDSTSGSSQLFPTFNNMPDVSLKYAKIMREVEIQNLLFQFLTQQLEQLKLQEIKETPSLQFIDLPVRPEKRVSPTRSIVAILIFLAIMAIGIVYLIFSEEYENKVKTLLRSALDT